MNPYGGYNPMMPWTGYGALNNQVWDRNKDGTISMSEKVAASVKPATMSMLSGLASGVSMFGGMMQSMAPMLMLVNPVAAIGGLLLGTGMQFLGGLGNSFVAKEVFQNNGTVVPNMGAGGAPFMTPGFIPGMPMANNFMANMGMGMGMGMYSNMVSPFAGYGMPMAGPTPLDQAFMSGAMSTGFTGMQMQSMAAAAQGGASQAQLGQMRIQFMMQNLQQLMEFINNIMKLMHDISMSIIRNIRSS